MFRVKAQNLVNDMRRRSLGYAGSYAKRVAKWLEENPGQSLPAMYVPLAEYTEAGPEFTASFLANNHVAENGMSALYSNVRKCLR